VPENRQIDNNPFNQPPQINSVETNPFREANLLSLPPI
jgi:hypothetical protein